MPAGGVSEEDLQAVDLSEAEEPSFFHTFR